MMIPLSRSTLHPFFVMMFACSVLIPTIAFAQTPVAGSVTTPSTPRISNEGTSSRYGLYEPLAGLTIPMLIGRLVRFATGIVGALFLVSFMYGGLLWMVSGGSTEKVEKAQKILSNALIGIVIVVASYLLVSVTFDVLNATQRDSLPATTSQTPPGAQQQSDERVSPPGV
jgi:hypothetical protein